MSFLNPKITSYTPVLTYSGGQSGITYNVQNGSFIKLGPLVFFSAFLNVLDKGTSTGGAGADVRISLPFTGNALYHNPCPLWGNITLTANYTYLGGQIVSTAFTRLLESGDVKVDRPLDFSQLATSFSIAIQGYFFTNA
jgi:hypothetical protein